MSTCSERIDSSEKLAETGSRQAFIKLKEAYPQVCLVHLYALEGAIQNIEFHQLFDFAPQELEMTGSNALLKQVWTNLIDNAVKFSPSKSKIDLSMSIHGSFFTKSRIMGSEWTAKHSISSLINFIRGIPHILPRETDLVSPL